MREFYIYTFNMNYDFKISEEALKIPATAYRPIKCCPFCQSIFINKKSCEDCGRSLQYHLIGEPFGVKSFYGIKERYIDGLNIFIQIFPFFENGRSPYVKSYLRKLEKRFLDLISAFNSKNLIDLSEEKLFEIELKGLVDEILYLGVDASVLQALLLENDCSRIGHDLLSYLKEEGGMIKAKNSWPNEILAYRLWNAFTVDYFFKVIIIITTILMLAVKYKEIISSQFDK